MAQNTTKQYDKNLNKVIFDIKHQQTFVMIKPDGVMRGLSGEIITRLERAGLKIVAMKMITPTEKMIRQHYPTSDEQWISRLGSKAKSGLDGTDLLAKDIYGTEDEKELGKGALAGLVQFMQSGPVIAMVIEGLKAVSAVRKIVGSTLPSKAEPGTIRGDFSGDDPIVANVEGRAIHNLIHASEIPEEAAAEIKLWFGDEPMADYSMSAEEVMYNKHY